MVGYVNPGNKDFIIGLRADMDALKIVENTTLPFKFKNEGLMHACGHDAHTAILLGCAKALKSIENELSCSVKLLFQPNEEGIKSGAIMMVENGAIDDVNIDENVLEIGCRTLVQFVTDNQHGVDMDKVLE